MLAVKTVPTDKRFGLAGMAEGGWNGIKQWTK
jgi:hypothetical protein